MNFILILVVVGICSFAQAKDCKDLPNINVSAQKAILNSPYTVVFNTFNTTFYCALAYYTSPVNAKYSLSATYVKKSQVISNRDLTLGPGDHDWDTQVDCATGVNTSRRFLAIKTPETNGVCNYSCDDQGKSITAFQCIGRKGWNNKDLDAALEMIKGTPGAPSASQQKSCSLPKGVKCAILS